MTAVELIQWRAFCAIMAVMNVVYMEYNTVIIIYKKKVLQILSTKKQNFFIEVWILSIPHKGIDNC